MRETTKCHKWREPRGDYQNYLNGSGIDIGSGTDVLRVANGSVRGWDVNDGDAQKMEGVADESFDFVYSSHCLEHMRELPEALRNWVRILKPGKWIYTVVPDYILYEKLTWPSRFNSDHKQSFSEVITREMVVRPNHWHIENDLIPLMQTLGLGEFRWKTESMLFNFNAGLYDQTLQDAVAQICIVAKKLE